MSRLPLHFATALLALFVLASCSVAPSQPSGSAQELAERYNLQLGPQADPTQYPPSAFDPARVNAFAIQVARDMQRTSLAGQTEVCANIIVRRDGSYALSGLSVGGPDWCSFPFPGPGEVAVADIHTHGIYLEGYSNELPSPQDMQSNMDNGLPGYVVTPAGRIWRIDNDSGEVVKLCGVGCAPIDPNLPAAERQPMPERFSRQQLLSLF